MSAAARARVRAAFSPPPPLVSKAVVLGDDPFPPDGDLFGHVDYATALLRSIEGSPTGITFGLFGPWGIGKTGVLGELERQASRDVTVVRFDAWRYRDDAFRREFLRDVAAQLREKKALRGFDVDRDLRDLDVDVSQPFEIFALSWRRLVPLLLTLATLAVAFLAVNGTVFDTTHQRLTLVAVMVVVTFLAARFEKLFELSTATESRRRLEDADRFNDRFREILGATRTRRLAIAVDNVDRLEPEAAIDVLSTIKTYLEPAVRHPRRGLLQGILAYWRRPPLVTFIVALDDRMLRAHLMETAPAGASAAYVDEFLRKFFPLRMAVRPVLDEDLRVFVERHARTLASRWVPDNPVAHFSKGEEPWIEQQTSELTELVLAGLQSNPRRVKQFFNSIEMALTVIEARRASGHIDGPPPPLALIGQLVFIEEELADRFEQLVRNDRLLEELHRSAQQGIVPEAWRDDWQRLYPVLVSTYSVERAEARTYLRLKLTPAERQLPDRDAILTALRTGNLDEAELRLDPQPLAEDDYGWTFEQRAAAAKVWADHLDLFVASELSAQRYDAAINVLRGGMQIEVLSAHRPQIARALGRALKSPELRGELWRLSPASLRSHVHDLPQALQVQLIDALARAYATNADLFNAGTRPFVALLAEHAGQIGPEAARRVRDALDVPSRAVHFDYAPLVAARPDLLPRSAARAALDLLVSPAEPQDRGDAAAVLARRLDGDAGTVFEVATRNRALVLDDATARDLAGLLSVAAADRRLQSRMVALIEHAVEYAESVHREALTPLLSSLWTLMREDSRPDALLATAALLRRGGTDVPAGQAIQEELARQPAVTFPDAIEQIDDELHGPLRGTALLALLQMSGASREREGIERALAKLDPTALANDVEPEAVALAFGEWIESDERNRETVHIVIDDADFDDRREVRIEHAGVASVDAISPGERDDPDVYRIDVTFDVSCRVTEEWDDEGASGHAESQPERSFWVTARLRRSDDEVTVRVVEAWS